MTVMSQSRPFHVLLAASEVAGFAKTGGLADVAAALPRALARRGHSVSIIMPLYGAVRRGGHHIADTGLEYWIPIWDRTIHGRLKRTTLPGSDVPVYLVEQPDYFERDDAGRGWGLYQHAGHDGHKRDYQDNAERYIFFGRAVMETLVRLDPRPEILHCNDWQTGLLPVYWKEMYGRHEPHRVRSLLTIHNIAYQGQFSGAVMAATGLRPSLFNSDQLEFYGNLSFLKAGCVFADALNTVSPRYAQEIQTPEFGCGMEGLLAARRHSLWGIVNGVDYGEWDPSIDRHIPVQYSPETVFTHKPLCKEALQRELGLPERADVPMLAIVARLADQKGIGLVTYAAHELLSNDLQLVVLGEGDPGLQHQLRDIQSRYPGKVGLRLSFDEGLAHRIEAGADIFLMPSKYEPSGLNQLYSLRYGTVPVVRSTGGLADTITDCTDETLAAGTATGFRFGPFNSHSMLEAIWRALSIWQRQPDVWRQIVLTGMRQDWSWNRSAAEYEDIYRRLVS